MGCCFNKNRVSDVSEPINVNKRQKTKHLFDQWPELPDYLSSKQNLMAHARGKKRENFDRLEQVSFYLDSLPTENDIERVWLIYTWIADNIAYNFEAYKSGKYGKCDANSVFESGKTVCSGYANLFQSLCNNIGIECITINGYSKGYGYALGEKFNDTNHAWNAVKINNKWYYVESTWGAGIINNGKFEKNFNPFWFFTLPETFLETHYSSDFHIGKNISLQEFENAHKNQLDYYLHGFQKLSLPTLIKSDHSPFCIELTCSKDCLLLAKLVGPNSSKEFDAHVQKDASTYPHKHCVIVEIPEKNIEYELKVFSKKVDSPINTYPQITSYNLVRKKDDVNRKIPKYSLNFGHGIRLLSHPSSYLYYDQNPLNLELSGAGECMLIASLNDESDVKLEDACLVQKSLDKKKFLLSVSCPCKGKFYLKLFWKEKNAETLTYDSLTKLILIKEKPAQLNDIIRYTSVDNKDAYVQQPIEYYLKKGNEYEFKINLDSVIKMALVDQNQNWNYFQSNDNSLYVLKWRVLDKGNVTVFAQFTQGSNFKSVCSYECI